MKQHDRNVQRMFNCQPMCLLYFGLLFGCHLVYTQFYTSVNDDEDNELVQISTINSLLKVGDGNNCEWIFELRLWGFMEKGI